MKNVINVSAILLAFSLIACQKGGNDEAQQQVTPSYTNEPQKTPEPAPVVDEDRTKMLPNNPQANTFISSSAAVENGKDTTRKFIRTAELKFKVKSVINSTYDIETIAHKNKGFVAYTNLNSNIMGVSQTAMSADSSLETTKYGVSNTMTLRVPNTLLDTTLKQIAKNIDYLDYRIIKAEDVALQMFSHSLTQKRVAKNIERVTNAIDNRGKKLAETTAAEETLNNRQAEADNATVSTLSLKDQIAFSTINLTIYQRETIRREMIANEQNIAAYEPSFMHKIWEALKGGWHILEGIFLFLTQIWGLILVGFAGYFLYRKYGNKAKK